MAEDLRAWLSSLGLGSHADRFADNGVDWDVLFELTEADLKELALSLGDRKRLMKAVAGLRTAEVRLSPQEEAAQPNLAAERRTITVMFVDLVGSTPMSERLDPEDLRDVLRTFHAHCATAIEAEDGHLARYLGDGVLVYFGYPRAHEDDAGRAVRAARAIVAGLRAGNEALAQQFGVQLQTRIGIHTGLVVVGDVGAGVARDREAIVGDTPNIAARIQAEAPPDTVLVSAATRRLIEGLFTLEDIGARSLKGLSLPVRLFRVTGPAESADPFDARVHRGLTPLVGREAELGMLRQRWEQARDGEMRCVLVVGEAGMGKSRLIRALRDMLGEDPHQFLTWYCTSYYQNSPFFPVIIWLRRALDLDTQDGSSVVKLKEAVEGLHIREPGATETLTTLLGLPGAELVGMSEISGLQFKRRVLDVLAAAIEAMAQRQALLLAVEDAHWIDPSTLELLGDLQERLSASRLMLLITGRPEFTPNWKYPQFVPVSLDRLSRRERHAMVERITGGKALPSFVLDTIVARTDGVPLFVEELTRTVLEGTSWRDAGTHYELEGPFQGVAIPDSLQGSLLARLDRLDPVAKELAQIGATIGREFDRDLVRLVTRSDNSKLEGVLGELVAAGIVQPIRSSGTSGAAYAFRHALIQDAAYQSLLLARRRQYHARIAEALSAEYPDMVAGQPEIVAQHLTLADQFDQAIDAWHRAGTGAMRRGAYPEAYAHLARGLELIERLPGDEQSRAARTLPFLLVRGRVEAKNTMYRATATYREAADVARQNGRARELAAAAIGFAEAEQLATVSPTPESITLVEEAIAANRDAPAELCCRLQCALGRALMLNGVFDRAAAVTAHARRMAEELNDQRSLRDVMANEILMLKPPQASEFEAQQYHIREFRRLSEQVGDLLDTIYAFVMGGTRLLEMGDLEGFNESVRPMEEMVKISRAESDRWMLLCLQALSATLHGDYAMAERHAGEAAVAITQTSFSPVLGIYGTQMFTIRREQGRLMEVAPLVKRFVDDNPADMLWRPGLMLIASDLGFQAEARRQFEILAESDFALPDDAKLALTLSYITEVCAELGDATRAEKLYELMWPYRDTALLAKPTTICVGAGAHFLGLLAGTMTDWDRAAMHFEAALVLNEKLKAWPRLAATRLAYARLLLARGRNQDRLFASELRGMAVAAAERMGMKSILQRDAQLDFGR
ncbi:ATP-binding protein [Reyranella sp.]|uniref:ATP-binding protein n=1 Tax=Reyranella sp. TaxID=1929291 RepID=UPI003D0DA316